MKAILLKYCRAKFDDRPPVANIDQILLTASLKSPDFSFGPLYCIEANDIQPVIVGTKNDLNDDRDLIEKLKLYIAVYTPFTTDKAHINDLQDVFKDKLSVLTGQSGAGNQLLNTLLPHLDSTDEISNALNKQTYDASCRAD